MQSNEKQKQTIINQNKLVINKYQRNNKIMGYNSHCYSQNCYSDNCCNMYGWCPSNYNPSSYGYTYYSCYYYYGAQAQTNTSGLIGGIVGGVVFFAIIVALIICYVKRRMAQNALQTYGNNIGQNGTSTSLGGNQTIIIQNPNQPAFGTPMYNVPSQPIYQQNSFVNDPLNQPPPYYPPQYQNGPIQNNNNLFYNQQQQQYTQGNLSYGNYPNPNPNLNPNMINPMSFRK